MNQMVTDKKKKTVAPKKKLVRSKPSAANAQPVFWTDIKNELARVTWPSRPVVIKSSGLVLLIMVLATVFVAAADIGFSRLFVSV